MVNPSKQIYGWFSKDGSAGDVIDFLVIENGMTFQEAVEYLQGGPLPEHTRQVREPSKPANPPPAPPPPIKLSTVEEQHNALLKSELGLSYLQNKRKMNLSDVALYKLGFIADVHGKGPAITIPYLRAGGVDTIKVRLINPPEGVKVRYQSLYSGYGHHLYLRSRLEEIPREPHVAIVEGEFKAMALTSNQIPTVGIPGITTMSPAWNTLFAGRGTVYVMLDPDKNPYDYVWVKALAYIHGNVRVVILPDKPDDMLMLNGGIRFLQQAMSEARRYSVSAADNDIAKFMARMKAK